MDARGIVFCGSFAHATDSEALQTRTRSVLGVRDGKILFLEPEEKLQQLLAEHSLQDANVVKMKEREFMIPGFVDTHAHAPQYIFTGTGMDHGLLDWLSIYTYPAEAKFKDAAFALDPYLKCVSRTLNSGTTTISYYATIHNEATYVLCDVLERLGQRAYVGKVNVDKGAPSYYLEKTQDSLHDTEEFIKNVLARKNPLLTPVVTPRFALACSQTLLCGVAALAKKYNLPVQTHLSETSDECQLVREQFPEARDYVDVYDKAGLLGDQSILGHCIHLSSKERAVLKQRGCGVAHCPNSNITLRSGMLNVRQLLEEGIKVGLGTDFGGGSNTSMLDAIRLTTQVSKVRSMLHVHGPNNNNNNSTSNGSNGHNNEQKQQYFLDYEEAFRLATLGGCKVLGLQERLGNFLPGKEFDALLVDPNAPDSAMDVFHWEPLHDVIQKFLFTGDDRNIRRVYVAGRQVKGDSCT